MSKKKKLGIEDINDNSSRELSGVINNIRNHESKYTTILVLFFTIAIFFIGYFSFRVKAIDYVLTPTEDNIKENSISSSSSLVVLNKDSILTDIQGINDNNNNYELNLYNDSEEDIQYIIKLVSDRYNIEKCNCKDKIIPIDKIKYSIDGISVISFNNNSNIIKTGTIESGSEDKINIKLWIDDNMNGDQDIYYYGRIVFEKIEE